MSESQDDLENPNVLVVADNIELPEDDEVEQVDNLKRDFIYYHPTINGTSWWECTCGKFLETDAKGVDRMLKRTVTHSRKTGHEINPRGN